MGRYLAVVLLVGLVVYGLARSASRPPAGHYPYGSAAFSRLIEDSYRESSARADKPFYAWLEQTYAHTPKAQLEGFAGHSLTSTLAARKRQLSHIKDPTQRSQLELATAAWLHRMVKATIPKFSLERGYEFSYTVSNGERQCLLQSVLIAGMLQEMGIQAGAYMVWKNNHGQVSNLGHVSAVVKLSDGQDVLVDASEPTPFFEHQGLFALVHGQYRFLEPSFKKGGTIVGYRVLADQSRVSPAEVTPLSNDYIRSQFYYYRGERAPGGFMTLPRTSAGLRASERFLEQAVGYAPENPLATYVLGLVLQREGKPSAAGYIRKGYALYKQFGFVPDGPRLAFKALK